MKEDRLVADYRHNSKRPLNTSKFAEKVNKINEKKYLILISNCCKVERNKKCKHTKFSGFLLTIFTLVSYFFKASFLMVLKVATSPAYKTFIYFKKPNTARRSQKNK
jgi:hypothetical protein